MHFNIHSFIHIEWSNYLTRICEALWISREEDGCDKGPPYRHSAIFFLILLFCHLPSACSVLLGFMLRERTQGAALAVLSCLICTLLRCSYSLFLLLLLVGNNWTDRKLGGRALSWHHSIGMNSICVFLMMMMPKICKSSDLNIHFTVVVWGLKWTFNSSY